MHRYSISLVYSQNQYGHCKYFKTWSHVANIFSGNSGRDSGILCAQKLINLTRKQSDLLCTCIYIYSNIHMHIIIIDLLVYIYNIVSRTECICIYCSYYIWFRNDSIYTSICLHTNICNSLSKFFPSMLFLFTGLRKPFLLHSKKTGWCILTVEPLTFQGS